ncbi:UDP-N-acetylmuramate--L-alanine ligase, partial [Candidatus Woesebacteria bacterium]|nr:UDP-N-acetylmuramate--L-alanine ligase [Candidatus Woesebacteria bacterium]
QCYDDYAHHPREIAVVLEAAKQWFATKRVLVAFQPHTYSRTKALFSDFVASLSLAPELVLLDIFSSARESDDPSVSSDLLSEAIRAKNSATTVKNLHTINELASYCREQLHDGDILLTLGAGDIYQVHDLLEETHE